MNGIQQLYPSTPDNVPLSITDPSPAFKTEVKKVMGSIVFFFIVYIILIVASVLLAIGSIYAGITVMAAMSSILGLIAGAGIISIGIMVFVFLIKFIFSVKKFDESTSVEIKEEDQPQLFGFIRQLTIDTHTEFPKKIVLSPEVNACVFYNDSFWSMIFPVKKNLQIGLGLVNTLTLSEFKAVMAHEFGHFSQRSMKLGSFVYNVNKAIYNMLFENNDYGSFLTKWGSLHWAIGIFVWLTVQIIKLIQKILQGMYSLINKSYMSLSREMEFHADAVAASVSGSKNCITAFNKLEVSDMCYNTVIQKADAWLQKKEVLENIYTKHHAVMKQYAKDFELPLQNNVPVVDESFKKRFQLSKVNIKDQWASHPSTEDRIAKLEELSVPAAADNQPAWVLFNNPESLQKQLSSVIYKAVPEEMKKETINETAFTERYISEVNAYSLPQEYNGYYDNRQLNEMDIETVFNQPFLHELNQAEFEKLFSNEKVALPKLILANQTDVQLLEAIISKQVDTKTFDYDGEKYNQDQAAVLLEKLKTETEQQKKQLQQQDEEVLSFFFTAAKKQSEVLANQLKLQYLTLLDDRKKIDQYFEICKRIVDLMAPLLQGQVVSIEAANEIAGGLRTESQTLKIPLNGWIQLGAFDSDLFLKERALHFLNTDYQYFAGDSFFDTELTDIHKLANETINGLSDFQFKNFKQILEQQLELFKAVSKLN
ncbi:MAG: M48 family metalloprotease [Lacibacter sp.]